MLIDKEYIQFRRAIRVTLPPSDKIKDENFAGIAVITCIGLAATLLMIFLIASKI